MNITIRAHHTSVFDDFSEHAEKRLARIERYLPRIDEVVVEVEHEETKSAADRYLVQVTLHSGGSILRAEERGADPRAALDAAADVLSSQARRHKKRLHDRHQHLHGGKEEAATMANSAAAAVEPEGDDEFDEYLLGKVVRVKQFEAKPMSQEEALAQMDLIGHDFFLFLDADSNEYALLYKRKDGDYGMLAPRRG
ncbi:MAG: ribosome-associated translation inhibitor RaiA [Chloroflexota bacterium]|nr:ribosome-associated translation inhibitor RaiA [Chloroflexota bacterium]